MKILCLYGNNCAIELFNWIEEQGHEITLWSGRLDNKWLIKNSFDMAVSYTYRYILSQDIINLMKGNVVNIHNSFLPWNRGADPNMWSIIDESPRGVTLHYMDAELDKGYIIAQTFVPYKESETLESSYYNLDTAAKSLFKEAFRYYMYWPEMKKKALGVGNYHSVNDGDHVKSLFDTYKITLHDFKKKIRDSKKGLLDGWGRVNSHKIGSRKEEA